MYRRALIGVVVAVALAAAPAAASASQALSVLDIDTSRYPSVSFRVGLPASMVTTGSAPVFEVAENGVVAPDVSAEPLTAAGRVPYIVLLIDTSGSMAGRPIADAKAAAMRFVDSLQGDARVGIVAFSDSPRVALEPTADRRRLRRAVGSLRASGETALYDGVVRAAALLPRIAGGQRGIVLLSDGGDTVSRAGLEQALRGVRATGVPVYAVALRSREADRPALAALSTGTGGRLVRASDSSSLLALFEGIAVEIRNTYEVTYRSLRPATKDVEIDVTARTAGGTATGVTAFADPRFEQVGRQAGTEPAFASVAEQPLLVLAIGALIFCSIAMLFGSGLLMLVRGGANTGQLRYYDQLQADHDDGSEHAGEVRARVVEAVAQVAGRRGITPAVTKRLESAGLPLRAAEYMTMHVLVVIGVGSVTELLTGSMPVAVLAVIVATVVPIVALDLVTTTRRRRFESQLPDILNMLASSLRGGWGIQQAIALVVHQAPIPASVEFRRVDAETRLGMPLERALERMALRLQSRDFEAAVSAIAIQREVGGNLAEVLDVVATTIRERDSLRRHVRSLTAESRLSAYILIALPFLILGVLTVVNPLYMSSLFTSAVGLLLGIMGFMALVVGIIWISAVAKVEV